MDIVDDELVEDVEDFNLELRFNPSLLAPPSGFMLDPNVATVYILDSDGNN